MFWELQDCNWTILPRSFFEAADVELKESRIWLLLAAIEFFTRTGVKTLKLPARSPNLNSHLERWNRSIREECLNHLVLFSEASLRIAIGEYIEHFHKERPHQGRGNEIIEPQFQPSIEGLEKVECRKRLVGLLKYYVPKERKAA